MVTSWLPWWCLCSPRSEGSVSIVVRGGSGVAVPVGERTAHQKVSFLTHSEMDHNWWCILSVHLMMVAWDLGTIFSYPRSQSSPIFLFFSLWTQTKTNQRTRNGGLGTRLVFSHLFHHSYYLLQSPCPTPSLLQFAWGCSRHELLFPAPEAADVELLHTTQTSTRTQTQHSTPPVPFSLPQSTFPGFETSRNSFPFYSWCVHCSTLIYTW